MLTGEQLRAGRAMLGWDQSELAEKADVSLKTIKRMEATSGRIDARSTWSVKNALEIAGIEFLDGDGDWRTRGMVSGSAKTAPRSYGSPLLKR
jgi:DNA-binding XRE family transcriptional regulator